MTYTITTWQRAYAPEQERWAACFNEIDLGVPTGSGATEEDAIVDLVKNHDLPEPRHDLAD